MEECHPVTGMGATLALDVWGHSHCTHQRVKVCLPGKGARLIILFHSQYFCSPAAYCPVAVTELGKPEVAPTREAHFSNEMEPRIFCKLSMGRRSPRLVKGQGGGAVPVPSISLPQGPLTLSQAPPKLQP